MKRLKPWIEKIEKYVDRWWYGPLLGFCAFMDHYVIVFPILGMMASSIFLLPKKWLKLTLWSAMGSWIGLWLLAWICQIMGLSFIQTHFPSMLQSEQWSWMQEFFSVHGLWLLFVVGLSPLPQQAAVLIVALAGAPILQIAAVLFVAKTAKFVFVGYLASHAPQKLGRLKQVKNELRELDLEKAISHDKR